MRQCQIRLGNFFGLRGNSRKVRVSGRNEGNHTAFGLATSDISRLKASTAESASRQQERSYCLKRRGNTAKVLAAWQAGGHPSPITATNQASLPQTA